MADDRRDARSQLVRLKTPAARLARKVTGTNRAGLQWRRFLRQNQKEWRAAVARADGPRILLGPTLGRHSWEVNFDAGLAIALTLRGARVELIVCNEVLPACSPWVYQQLPEPRDPEVHTPSAFLCDGCYPPSLAMLEPLGLPIHRLGELVTPEERSAASRIASSIALTDIDAYEWNGVAVGEHAMAGAIRFYGSADLFSEPKAEPVLRRYFDAALNVTHAMDHLLRGGDYAAVCCTHGIYVPHGLVTESCLARGVRIVNWHRAYRDKSVILSEGGTYHRTLLDEPVSTWDQMAWTPELEKEVMRYLDDREYGKGDWISFNRTPDADSLDALRGMGVDLGRPMIGLLTNVAWDAQLHYGASPFDSMMEWLVDTVGWFREHPELQLVIRVHPAEIKGYITSRQPAAEAIRRAHPELPSNVFIIGPESTISTYETMSVCNAVIIYATKTGIELAARGIPTIVAGEAWTKNKGFALDASSRDEYFALLDRLPLEAALDEEQTTRARQYAYHFFFRRMIPLPFLDETLRFRVEHLDQLRPGADPGLDVVCDGLIDGAPFVYRAELEPGPR